MELLERNAPCWCGSGKKYKKCHYNFGCGIIYVENNTPRIAYQREN